MTAIVGYRLAIDGEISYMKRAYMPVPEMYICTEMSAHFLLELHGVLRGYVVDIPFLPSSDVLKFSKGPKGYLHSARSQDLWLGSEWYSPYAGRLGTYLGHMTFAPCDTQKSSWLVVSNIFIFHDIWVFILPIDFHIFPLMVKTTNQVDHSARISTQFLVFWQPMDLKFRWGLRASDWLLISMLSSSKSGNMLTPKALNIFCMPLEISDPTCVSTSLVQGLCVNHAS